MINPEEFKAIQMRLADDTITPEERNRLNTRLQAHEIEKQLERERALNPTDLTAVNDNLKKVISDVDKLDRTIKLEAETRREVVKAINDDLVTLDSNTDANAESISELQSITTGLTTQLAELKETVRLIDISVGGLVRDVTNLKDGAKVGKP